MTCWFPNNLVEWVQILQFFVISVAVLYGIWQFREAHKLRLLQATREVLNEIGTEEVREARYYVLKNIPESSKLADLTKDQRIKVRKIAVAYDRIGYIRTLGLLPEGEFFELQKDEIEQLWKKLGIIVEDVRISENRPNYCKHFQDLATEWFPKMKEKIAQRHQ